MLRIILKWLAGFTFVIAQSEGNKVIECASCIGDEMFTHCNCENSVTFPSTVVENVENLTVVIYVTNQNKLKFEKQHLSKYVALKKLTIQAARVTELEISPDLLELLNKLEILNLSFLDVPPPRLPESIKTLIMNSIGNDSHPDMSSLKNLEMLSFRSNYQEDFPKISELAPLFEVDFSGNPLRNMTYRDLSPFCLMKTLTVTGSLVEKDPARCCGLRTWIKDANITSDLYCSDFDAKCDTFDEHDDESDETYRKCLVRTGQVEDTTFIELTLHYFVAVALIVALAFLVYRYYGSHAVKTHRKSQKAESIPGKSNTDDEEDEEEPEEDIVPVPVKH